MDIYSSIDDVFGREGDFLRWPTDGDGATRWGIRRRAPAPIAATGLYFFSTRHTFMTFGLPSPRAKTHPCPSSTACRGKVWTRRGVKEERGEALKRGTRQRREDSR